MTFGRIALCSVKGIVKAIKEVTGNGIINLTNLTQLLQLKAYGGTELRILPEGYTQLEYVDMNSGSYLITDIIPTYNGHYEINLQTKSLGVGGCAWIGARDGSAGSGMGAGYSQTNAVFFDGFGTRYNGTYTILANKQYRYIWNNKVATLTTGGSTVATNTFTNTGTTTNYLTINGMSSSGSVILNSSQIYVYSFKAWDNGGNLIANYIPAKNSSNVVGFYDMVSGTFKTATVGTFSAGTTTQPTPTPTSPVDIVSNNGKLRAKHQSGLPLGYTKLEKITFNSGYIVTDVYPNQDTEFIVDFKKGNDNLQWIFGTREYVSGTSRNKYSLQAFSNSTTAIWIQIDNTTQLEYNTATRTTTQEYRLSRHTAGFKNGQVYLDGELQEWGNKGTPDISSFTTTTPIVLGGNYASGGGYVDNLFIGDIYGATGFILCKRNSDNAVGAYNTATGVFCVGAGTLTAGNVATDPIEIYLDTKKYESAVGTGSQAPTPTPTSPVNPQFYTVGDMVLRKIGDYADSYDASTKKITRNVGVKILDGTESWTAYNSGMYFALGGGGSLPRTEVSYCTHFSYGGPGMTIASLSNNQFSVAMNGNCSFKSAQTTDTTTRTNWLKGQYNNGTPVTIWYPLATSTEETVIDEGTVEKIQISNLPAGYTELEYIESTGTQWIDTGFIANNGCVIDAKVMPINNKMYIGSIAPSNISPDLTRNILSYNGDSYTPQKLGNFSSTLLYSSSQPAVLHFDTTGTKFYCSVDGNVVVESIGTGVLSNQTTTVKISYTDYVPEARPGRYYYVKIYNSSNVLVRDYIPAKRESDGVIGMYDLVSSTFYTNSGTGTFTGGPLVKYATAEMLLGATTCGDNEYPKETFRDEQEVIRGDITRNMCVVVLTGDETVQANTATTLDSSYSRRVTVPILHDSITGTIGQHKGLAGLCSHFVMVPNGNNIWYKHGTCAGITAEDVVIFNINGLSTTTQFQNWLKAQYNAGTPVMLVYKKKTASAESVEGQTLQGRGNCKVEIIEASIDNLPLYAKYRASR